LDISDAMDNIERLDIMAARRASNYSALASNSAAAVPPARGNSTFAAHR
jgi:hypothetical protein